MSEVKKDCFAYYKRNLGNGQTNEACMALNACTARAANASSIRRRIRLARIAPMRTVRAALTETMCCGALCDKIVFSAKKLRRIGR